MVEIFINDQPIELSDDKDITYTLQVNDIADVASRQASYTSSFKFPKTPQNTNVVKGLGLVGDTSRIPYQKPKVTYKDNGFDVIPFGWGVIKNTDKDYNLSIYNGIIDFFKAIENKTLGNDLDLSEINHNKTTQTVVDSFTAINQPYCYLVADYNGRTHFDVNNIINIDYLPPSVQIDYLWRKVFTTFGFTFVGNIFNTDRFTNWWLTYPKGIAEQNGLILNIFNRDNNLGLITNQFITVNNFVYTVVKNVSLRIEFLPSFYYEDSQGQPFYQYTSFSVNGALVASQISFIDYYFYAGDTFTSQNINTFLTNESDGIQSISILNNFQNFNEELKDFSITDFIKEVVNEFALTMFTDNQNKIITFLTIQERIETSQIVNWSDKYVERTNETYIFDTYAQKNNFKFQYNDKEDNHNDGAINIDNVNIKDSTDVWKSVTYSPEKNPVPFVIGAIDPIPTVPLFKQYDKEITETNTADTKVKYKPLQKRYYFQRKDILNATATFGSIVLNSQLPTNTITMASFRQLDMNSVIGLNYLPMQTILNDSRLHTMKLALNIIDIMVLDFKKLYYFEQESMYYLLNKINFKNGTFSTAEFIRVKL